MKKYFIPIIGTISAGKSQFLQGLLGTNVLQSGSTTTTKFVCLIKNSLQLNFYHVIPKKEKGITFEKEGEEIKEKEKIKLKIEEINKNLSDKKATISEMFYILETPIKNIENATLLDECYFMDIPGLNEIMNSYIENIFSIISIEDILFEIIVFDSTNIGSDSILEIIKELDKKHCLKKAHNLFILNKIDLCTKNGNETDIINTFKDYFYKTFQDEKNKNTINLNIYDNYFIPLNSILYLAETQMCDDFSSMLIFELFKYKECINKYENSTFYEFIKDRIDSILKDKNLEIDNNEIKKIGENEMKIIVKSVENLKKIENKITKNSDFQIGIKLNNKSVEKELKKLYIIHKNKNYNFFHTTYYNDLQEILKTIHINENDLPSPPSLNDNDNNIKNENNISQKNLINNKNFDVSTIKDLEQFLVDTFKEIDPNNELPNFNIALSSLRENILGKKIRIALIGNISVGKSTVLNCIIGKEILPTKDSECTYRGVILRYKNTKEFKLYKTKLISQGKGLDKYYFFQTQQYSFCQGIENIKSHLQNTNNDKEITDDDAYFVIEGKLKIFDFIKLDEKLINIIEFIDLPGYDRKNNKFNENKYYEKILKFSNCCIYINDPKSIDDKKSVDRMVMQYLSDKEKVFPILRKEFIKTCLFLINKSEYLENEDRISICNKIYKNISIAEKYLENKNLNIAFFSAISFLEYLEIRNDYIENFENITILKKLYNKFNNKLFYGFRGFKHYADKTLSRIEENFDLNLDEEIEIKNDLKCKFYNTFEDLCKKHNSSGLNINEVNEIIKKICCLYKQFKSKNFSKTKYSHKFFDILKDVIIYSENLQNKNLQKSISDFFSYTDELFNKELKEETEKEKEQKKQYFEYLNEIFIPGLKKIFEQTQKKLRESIQLGKYKALELINEEIDNIKERIKDSENDIEKAGKILIEKIEVIINEVKSNQNRELELLQKEIEGHLKEVYKKFENKNNLDNSTLESSSVFDIKMIASLITSTVTGFLARQGVIYFLAEAGTSAAATTAAGATIGSEIGGMAGPIGLAVGIGVGLILSAAIIAYNISRKDKKYLETLKKFKEQIEKNFKDSENNCENNFIIYKEETFKRINIRLEIHKKEIKITNKEKWEKYKEDYNNRKNKIMNQINSMNFNNNENGNN